MTFEQIRYYVEIIRTGSLTQAAKNLYVSQPALSRMIAILEKELGFTLIVRSKQGIAPTAEGLEVYADCEKIIALYDQCRVKWTDIAFQQGDQAIEIGVVALPMMCNSIINDAIYRLSIKYPNIQVKLYSAQLDTIYQYLSGKATVLFCHYDSLTKDSIYQYADAHELVLTPLFDDEYKFFCRADDEIFQKESVKLADLENYALATYSNTIPSRHILPLDTASKQFKKTYCLANKEAMIQACINSKVVTGIAEIMCSDSIYYQSKEIKAIPLQDFRYCITYFVLHAKNLCAAEKIVVDELVHTYKKMAGI